MGKIKDLLTRYTSSKGDLFRYSLSYCLLLSIFPALTIILFFFKSTGIDAVSLINGLYEFIPQDLIEPFVEFILTKDYSTFVSLIVTLVVACYVSSKAFYSLMLLSEEDEGFEIYKLLVRIKAFVSFSIFILIICAISIVNQFIDVMTSYLFLMTLPVVFYFMYRILSFEKKPWSYGIVGSIFSSVSIVFVGNVFLWFIKYFTRYDSLYGPIVSLVILFLAVYIISSIIYFGYCLNGIYGKSYDAPAFKHLKSYQWGNKMLDKIMNHFR